MEQDSKKAKGFIVFGEHNYEAPTALSSYADVESAIAALPSGRTFDRPIGYDSYSIMNVETLQPVGEWSYHYDCSGAPCFYELKMD